MEAVLYGFRFSHPCITAELMLRHKRVPFTYREVTPGLHPFVLRGRGFKGRTVPALRLGAERIQGSRPIAAALEAAFGDRPSLFADDRDAIEAAERRGEELQDAARRIAYFHLRRMPEALTPFLGSRLGARLLVPLASLAHGASDSRVRADLAELPARLDEVDRWLEAGLLGGPNPNAADFQIAPSLRMLLLFEATAAEVERRPAGRYSREIVPEYPPLGP